MGHALHNRPVSSPGKMIVCDSSYFPHATLCPLVYPHSCQIKNMAMIFAYHRPAGALQLHRITNQTALFKIAPYANSNSWKAPIRCCHCYNYAVELIVSCRNTALSNHPFSHIGIDFSRDGSYMALAERRDCKDYVSVFVCDDWHLLRVSEFYGQYDIFNSEVYTLSM